ncbi:MAG: ABC transporter permease [Thermoanaerobaculales bacterium]|nr:ABC transporter permease [Thermoanaerobaculales bacterium]
MLGFLWSFVQPLWSLALFTFLFSTVMKISPGIGERTSNFAIFLFCGLLPWMAMNEGISRATTAITDSAGLVKKMSFPSELLVFAVVLAALLHEAIAAVLFGVVLSVGGHFSASGLGILLIAVPLQVILTVGLGLFAAALHVFFRDTAQIIVMLMPGWFYITPIVYPIGLVPVQLQPLLELNPLTILVKLYREAFLGGELPALTSLLPLVFFACISFASGLWFFMRVRPTFADEI